MNSSRLRKIVDILDRSIPEDLQTYPRDDHPNLLKRGNAFECLISIIISQRTTLENEVKAQDNLFTKFRTPDQVASARVGEIARLIRPAGLANRKALQLKKIAVETVNTYHGRIDELGKLRADVARRKLMELPQVGKKSADCMLLWGLKKAVLPVDINVCRTSKRLGLTSDSAGYETIQRDLSEMLPRSVVWYRRAHSALVYLGKYYCKPRPLCEECPVKVDCPSAGTSL